MESTNSSMQCPTSKEQIRPPEEFWSRLIQSEVDVCLLLDKIGLSAVNVIHEAYSGQTYVRATIVQQNNRVLFKYFGYRSTAPDSLQAHRGILCAVLAQAFPMGWQVKAILRGGLRAFYVKVR